MYIYIMVSFREDRSSYPHVEKWPQNNVKTELMVNFDQCLLTFLIMFKYLSHSIYFIFLGGYEIDFKYVKIRLLFLRRSKTM